MQDDPLKDVTEDDDFEEIVDVTDIGSAISGESYFMEVEGGLFLEGDEVKAWDVDLGEFLNDGEGDPVPTFTLKTFFEQDVPIIVLALVCFLVVVVAIVLLFCMYFGYV